MDSEQLAKHETERFGYFISESGPFVYTVGRRALKLPEFCIENFNKLYLKILFRVPQLYDNGDIPIGQTFTLDGYISTLNWEPTLFRLQHATINQMHRMTEITGGCNFVWGDPPYPIELVVADAENKLPEMPKGNYPPSQ